MAENNQASENENWEMLRDEAVVDLMNLVEKKLDLVDQIEAQLALIELFDSLLKPPE